MWYDRLAVVRRKEPEVQKDFGYNEKSEVSEKSKHTAWAKKNADVINELVEPSRKFILQLDKLFDSEATDIAFISERIQAAYDYFFLPMDNLVAEILWKLEEIT